MKCWGFIVRYKGRSGPKPAGGIYHHKYKIPTQVENISEKICRQRARQLCSEDRFTKAFSGGTVLEGLAHCDPPCLAKDKATLSFSSIQKKSYSSLFVSCIRKQEKQSE